MSPPEAVPRSCIPPGDRAPSITDPTEVIGNEPFLAKWRELWVRLNASYFLSPDWMLSWWEWAGRPPCELACWIGPEGRMEAIIGLALSRERLHPGAPLGVRTWTNLGSGAGSADHHGWLAESARESAVWSWLESKRRDRSILLRSLSPHLQGAAPPDASWVESSRCPRLGIGAGSVQGGSADFRKRIRYYQRRLEGAGVSFRWLPPGEMSAGEIDLLYRLHAGRHSLKEERSSFRAEQRDLHRHLARRGSVRWGGPAAVIASRDGEAIGMLYGFLTPSTFAYYQSGWLPEWADRNLGTVMTAQAMEFATLAGARVFDFLRGPEPYKYRFGAADVVDRTLMLPAGLPGRLLALKYRLKAYRKGRGAVGMEPER